MEDVVTLQNIASIATFIAPGYFAIQTYSAVYAKRERDISRLIIESIAFSLPLVAVANYIWHTLLHLHAAAQLDTGYVLLVLVLSLLAGWLASFLRVRTPVRQILEFCGMGHPDEDYIRRQFSRLKSNDAVTVKLKSGPVFSGTPESGRVYVPGTPERYYFSNLAWATDDGGWREQDGGLIVDLEEVEYIVTAPLPSERAADLQVGKRQRHTKQPWLIP